MEEVLAEPGRTNRGGRANRGRAGESGGACESWCGRSLPLPARRKREGEAPSDLLRADKHDHLYRKGDASAQNKNAAFSEPGGGRSLPLPEICYKRIVRADGVLPSLGFGTKGPDGARASGVFLPNETLLTGKTLVPRPRNPVDPEPYRVKREYRF